MAATPSTPVRAKLSKVVPHMIELTETVLFGDVWERPGLFDGLMTHGGAFWARRS